jgi:enamine deaminase RidA (YjgF/YER057c/UK114 family)
MRRAHRSGGAFEAIGSYSRAVRVGSTIAVSGTAAIDSSGATLHPGDTHAQTRECINRAVASVVELGGRIEDVVRTRVYLAPEADWRGAVEAHREAFVDVGPANTTLFVAGFIPPGVLVEVELEAILER